MHRKLTDSNSSTDQVFGITFKSVAISVASLDRSIEFYERVLGFSVATRTYFEPVSAHVAIIKIRTIELELLEVSGSARLKQLDVAPPDHLLNQGFKALVFEVLDLSLFTAFIETQNVDIVWRELVLDETGATSTLFRDPDGNLISVFEARND